MTQYTYAGLFSGAGGLDLGFANQGFQHAFSTDLDPWAVATLRTNRPDWHVLERDVHDLRAEEIPEVDVLLAGVPCQGFSLGGRRQADDPRNDLYQQVLRIAETLRPRVIVIENVLNLRTMRDPLSGLSFSAAIERGLMLAGYESHVGVFRMSEHGVPQTRRRFVFVGFRGGGPLNYHLPEPSGHTPIREFLFDLANDQVTNLPNHKPRWGFGSAVHVETGEDIKPDEPVLPVRLSRTASDGHPIRSYDEPFPAIDSATIWGWAQGNVQASRVAKDRENGKFIRNPTATVTLWRVRASRLRSFTHREYARLQTFPDSWVFQGGNLRHVHLQIGNAVPVTFAQKLAENIRLALEAMNESRSFPVTALQPALL